MKLLADLRRRHRGFVTFISLVIAMLSILTVRIAFHLIWPGDSDRIEFAREWGALLVLALPWTAAILLVVRYSRHRAAHAQVERSIADSVRALLDENRLSRARLKIVGLMHGLLLLILPLVVYQLRAAGKAGDEILVPAFVLWPLIAAGIGAGLIYHYRRKLLPQKRELEALLNSYE